MLIVIIDAFDEGKAEERRQFAAFERTCRAAIAASGAGQPQIRVVPRKEIVNYIYDSEEPASSPSGLKAFDRVDIFLIGCAPNLLPWEAAGRELYVLLKTCFFTKKCVFGAGGVGQFLAFLCTGRGIDINPVNGREGGSLQDLDVHELAARVEFPRKDVLLDCDSGDFFMFEHRRHRWVPFCTVGSKKKSRQRRAVRRHQHRVTDPSPHVYLSKSDETICRIVNRYGRHALFKGIDDLDLVVRSRPGWMLDGNALRRAKHRPEVLAQSALAPLVLQYHNFIAAHFDVSAEYAPAARMLRNYVQDTVRRMQHHGHLDMPSRVYLSFKSQTAKAEERIKPPAAANATQARAQAPAQQAETDAQILDALAASQASEAGGATGAETSAVARQSAAAGPRMKRTKSNLEMHSGTRTAQASDCVFLRTDRARPTLSRSKLSPAERRAATHDSKARPQSAAPFRKTNYARNAHLCELDDERAETLASPRTLAQTKRLRAARAARSAAGHFPTKSSRPRSAPSAAVRRSSHETRAATFMARVPPTHVYDRSRHLPLEDLLQSALSATHNLRTLEAHVELAPARSAAAAASPKAPVKSRRPSTKSASGARPATAEKCKMRVPRIELGREPLVGGTINADGPYQSQFDRTRGAYLEEKKKWVSQSQVFNHHVGTASRVEREDAVSREHAPGRDEFDGYRPIAHHCFREPAKKKTAWLPA